MKTPPKKYFFLGGLLFVLICLPPFFVTTPRVGVISMLSPIFSGATKVRALFFSRENKVKIATQKLASDNHLLRLEVNRLLMTLGLQKNALNDLKTISARVVYREASSWNSSLWINVGLKSCPQLKKDAPVLVGKALVGAIDEVGEKVSRVRLLTDSALNVSVQAERGPLKNAVFIEYIDSLQHLLQSRNDLFANPKEKKQFARELSALKNALSLKSEGWYLAKGVIHGTGSPLWRSYGLTLKGSGFNFENDESKAALPSGIKPIQVGDLLVTTGLDGIFPAGLKVAVVTKVAPLERGGYAYDLEAKPVAGNLDELHMVTIMTGVENEGSRCK